MKTLYGGAVLRGDAPDLVNIEKVDRASWGMTAYMAARGLQVDLSHFARLERELQDDMEEIESDVQAIAGHYVNLDSGDQVAHLLFKELGLKQARPKMTDGGDRESVEDSVLVAIQHDHEVVPKILDFKELSKLRGTYVMPMPKLARKVGTGQWRMFPNFTTTRIPSGRFACKKPNLLAMPNRTKRGREVLMGFITDPGWCFLSIDFSQIEPRVVAHRSGDRALMNVYFNEEDIYSDFAIAAFRLKDTRYRDTEGWHYPGVDKKEHRFPSKTCILASIYDVTGGGLLEQMPIVCATCGKEAKLHDCSRFVSLWTEDKCQDLINAFYMKYPGIMQMRKMDHARARQHGYLWDDFGRLQHVAAVRSVHPWVVGGALREGANMPIQGTACAIFKLGMGQVMEDLEEGHLLGVDAHPLLPVHDEIVLEVREELADELGHLVMDRFEHIVQLKVPVKASMAKAPCWGALAK